MTVTKTHPLHKKRVRAAFYRENPHLIPGDLVSTGANGRTEHGYFQGVSTNQSDEPLAALVTRLPAGYDTSLIKISGAKSLPTQLEFEGADIARVVKNAATEEEIRQGRYEQRMGHRSGGGWGWPY